MNKASKKIYFPLYQIPGDNLCRGKVMNIWAGDE